jgi:protein KRI1
MPTRFKYAHVPAQSFALTPAEILLATDAELNQYLSVKKYAPYRKEGRWDRTRAERLKEFKEKMKTRNAWLNGGDPAEEESLQLGKKRKGKKERVKAKEGLCAFETAPQGEVTEPTGPIEEVRDGKPSAEWKGVAECSDNGQKRRKHKVRQM